MLIAYILHPLFHSKIKKKGWVLQQSFFLACIVRRWAVGRQAGWPSAKLPCRL